MRSKQPPRKDKAAPGSAGGDFVSVPSDGPSVDDIPIDAFADDLQPMEETSFDAPLMDLFDDAQTSSSDALSSPNDLGALPDANVSAESNVAAQSARPVSQPKQKTNTAPKLPSSSTTSVAQTAPRTARRTPRTAEGRAEDALMRRVPPHSVEAEQAVLGGIFLRTSVIHSLVDLLSADDFYLPAHQILYRSFMELYRKSAPIDLVSVAEFLRNHNQFEEAGGAVYLSELTQAVVSGANAEYYATIVRDKALQRGLINACSGIISNCYDASRDVGALLDESEQAVFTISQRTTGKDFSGTKELVDKVFDNLTKLADAHDVVTGVTTGYSALDRITAGLQPSDLIIVAARPSMGKTAFAMCMAVNAAIQQNVPVAVYSLEMSKEQLMQRMLAVHAKVDVSLLRRPSMLKDEDWAKLYAAADTLGKAPIFVDDTPALSTLELRARTRRLKAEHNVGLVIVDYLQLMRAGRRIDSRELEISEISRSLKGLAKEMNVPVVALSQLNRKVEERSTKNRRPLLSDLRESGAIEQDADVIMFVYRDDVYKYEKPADRPPQGIAEIIIGKQRNGPVGDIELLFISKYTSFENLTPEWAPPPSENT